MAKVIGIARKAHSRAPMEELSSAKITQKEGVEGDYRGRKIFRKDRQVTLLSSEQWTLANNDLMDIVPWTARLANVFLEGIVFVPEHLGRKLLLGTAVVEITGETEPCERMDENHPGLKKALEPDWRAGVTCRVIEDGEASIDSPAKFIG